MAQKAIPQSIDEAMRAGYEFDPSALGLTLKNSEVIAENTVRFDGEADLTPKDLGVDLPGLTGRVTVTIAFDGALQA